MLGDPPASVRPSPDYPTTSTPIGIDTSSVCLRLTLQAVDAARTGQGLVAMDLPSDFAALSVPEQVFVSVDRERVDHGLPPFTGLDASLDRNAGSRCGCGRAPAGPGRAVLVVGLQWIGAVTNGLDATYQWMYDDGPGTGVPHCGQRRDLWVLGRPPQPPRALRARPPGHGRSFRSHR